MARYILLKEGENAAYPYTKDSLVLDGAGKPLPSVYAKQTGTYAGMSVGSAENAGRAASAGSADKAAQDGNGNNIADTYATKNELNAGLQKLYPVGSVYFSTVNTNPATLFGFGTWQAWGTGRVPVGVDPAQTEFNTAEKTGGEKAHALTAGEMPSHTHEITYRTIGDPSDDVFALFDSGAISGTNNSPGSALPQDSLEASAAGGGAAHNNLQPYITCYMWKRTA